MTGEKRVPHQVEAVTPEGERVILKGYITESGTFVVAHISTVGVFPEGEPEAPR